MTVLSLVDRVRDVCAERGIKLVLSPTDSVPGDNGEPLLGYFDDDVMTLAVAVAHAEWIDTLTHEFCHVMQWIDGVHFGPGLTAASDVFDDWIVSKVEHDDATVTAAVRVIQACEMDCERRTLPLLVGLDLCRDPEAYTRRANAYVLSYEAARLTRCWGPDAISSASVLALVPPTFIDDTATLPAGYLDAYAAASREDA